MCVVVCIKQVPDTSRVRLDPKTHVLLREGVESILNPDDEYALELALQQKDASGARVIAVSMGPGQAEVVLREALARGADAAYLISSRAFGGSDTLATSRALSRAVLAVCGGVPDLVLFGRQALDGDTAQVGPGVSACLELPLVPYVRDLEVKTDDDDYCATSVQDDGVRLIVGRFPAVMTVVRGSRTPRFASLAGAMRAARVEIPIMDEKAIGLCAESLGLTGSPTKVVRVAPPPTAERTCRTMSWTGDVKGLLSCL